MSDFNLKRPSMVEDAKAELIFDQITQYGGEIRSGQLEQELHKKQGAMSRSTFFDKLKLLEQLGLLRREARMEGNKAVAYLILAEPYLGISQRMNSDPFTLQLPKVMERLRAPEVLDEEKEEILAGLLKAYMDDSRDWILNLVRESLQAEDLNGAFLASIFSARYLFGARLTTIALLYWEFRAYGAGGLRRVEESEEKLKRDLREIVRQEMRHIEDLM